MKKTQWSDTDPRTKLAQETLGYAVATSTLLAATVTATVITSTSIPLVPAIACMTVTTVAWNTLAIPELIATWTGVPVTTLLDADNTPLYKPPT